MAVALPAGWIDTGFARTFACSGNISLDWRFDFGIGEDISMGDLAQVWRFFWGGSVGVSPPPVCFPDRNGLNGTLLLRLSHADIGTVTLATYPLACAETTYRFSTPTFPHSIVIGPLRLGVRLVLNTEGQNPSFARHYDYEYAWFVDGLTTRQEFCAGYSSSIKYWLAIGSWGTPQNTLVTPVNLNGGALQWEVNVPTGISDQIRLTGLTVDGVVVDTSELNTAVQKGQGGGSIRFDGPGSGQVGSALSPYMLDESAALSLFGGVDPALDTLDADSNIRTTPWQVSRTRHQVSWPTTQPGLTSLRTCFITAGSAAAQNPALPSDDRQLLSHLAPPRLFAGAGYQPVTISLAPEVEVHRPGGIIPSNWVSSDTDKITVMENMTETIIEVAEEGATITRTFAGTQRWRDHVGLGTGGTLHADFGIEDYEVYKSNYFGAGEDVWPFGTYAWLSYRIAAAVDGDSALALAVIGNHLEINDPHTTGAGRVAGYVATLHPYEAVYALDVGEGTNEGRVDLLFPATPVPFYHGRVDSLVMSGFKVGTYRIKRLVLQATGQAYLKIAWGKQVQRSDYSSIVAAVNGAFVFGNWPDQTLKPDETGDYGGSVRYINILTGDPSGEILDTQKGLSEFILLLNKIEGWSASYSDAAHDAAFIDAQGKELTPELAQFLRPVVPYQRLSPGAVFSPECAIVCGRVNIAPGMRFTVPFDLPLWGALEAQAKTDGLRAEAGAPVDAIRVDTGAVVATGETDEDGYVCVAPVPANGSLVVTLQDGS